MFKYFLHYKNGELVGYDKASEFVTADDFPNRDSIEVSKEEFEKKIAIFNKEHMNQ
jgi:hypothetical protein